MNGFEVLEDSVTGTSLQYRVLRTMLTANLPKLHLELQQTISRAFDADVFASPTTTDGNFVFGFQCLAGITFVSCRLG